MSWCRWGLVLGAVGWLLGSASAQTPTTLPTLTDAQQRQLADLLSIVEGPNTRSARLTGVRQMLRLDWVPDGTFVGLLTSTQAEVQAATAGALGEFPDRWTPELTPPLVDLLRSDDEAVRTSVTAALAAGPVERTVPALAETLRRQNPPAFERLLLETLARIPAREALGVLVETILTAPPETAAYARVQLADATGQAPPADAAALRAWWDRTRTQPLATWQRNQIQLLQGNQQRLARRVRELESRLSAALRDAYLRLPESERDATVVGHLEDVSATVRLLGLDLVQSSLADGRELPATLLDATRSLLYDGDPLVRAVAAQTVAAQRRAEDEATFLEILADERNVDVQRAVINGLGYLGTAQAIEPLLAFVQERDPQAADEAIRSLGRLAERGMLPDAARAAVADRLLDVFALVRNHNGHEARVLWAMARVGDPRFGPIFIDVARTSENPATRLAALRAIALRVRHEPPVAARDALRAAIVDLTSDADLSTRRVAVETLAALATPDQLDALCARLSPETEPEDGIRRAAWTGVERLLAELPADRTRAYVDLLTSPPLDDEQRQRVLEVALGNLPAEPDRSWRGRLRAELAPLLIRAGQVAPARDMALAALGDLHAAGSDDLTATATLVLDLALRSGGYDAAVAEALNAVNPLLDLDALWAVRTERIADLLKPPTAAVAVGMLRALETHPPAKLGPAARERVRELRRQGEELIRVSNRRIVEDALTQLRDQPDNAEARAAIVTVGAAAIPVLQDTLRRVLRTEPLDAEAERRIHDLLRQLQPEWPGFPPDASLEQKLSAIGGTAPE